MLFSSNLSHPRKDAVLVYPVLRVTVTLALDLVRLSLDIGPGLVAGASASAQPLRHPIPHTEKGKMIRASFTHEGCCEDWVRWCYPGPVRAWSLTNDTREDFISPWTQIRLQSIFTTKMVVVVISGTSSTIVVVLVILLLVVVVVSLWHSFGMQVHKDFSIIIS